MFYAHFVLSKRGPLARIWLAAHWDKKLTKAAVFETNIDSSVEAILQPKVKLALRTSGHLLLGVVRIYSRKAKYLLADCNEAFVKIKMAFRPGIVELHDHTTEAAIATITLPENFHDFDTTMAELDNIDVQAQFTVNQSRPEEITMKEDISNMTYIGDDGFGDLGFDDHEFMRESSQLDSLEPSKASDLDIEVDKTLTDLTADVQMPQDHPEALETDALKQPDDFGDHMEPVFLGGADDDMSDDDAHDDFGGDMADELFGEHGGLFEEPPLPAESEIFPPDTSDIAVEPKDGSTTDEPAPEQPSELPTLLASVSALPANNTTAVRDQTTLIGNEQSAFVLEPVDASALPVHERRPKRKRKLVVDEHKGLPSDAMKVQLSDTSDVVSALDLAPPTKKLMHWKETGGVEKLFALSGRPLPSKYMSKLFVRNLVTSSMTTEELDEQETDKLELDQQEMARAGETTAPEGLASVMEETSAVIRDDTTLGISAIQDISAIDHITMQDDLVPNLIAEGRHNETETETDKGVDVTANDTTLVVEPPAAELEMPALEASSLLEKTVEAPVELAELAELAEPEAVPQETTVTEENKEEENKEDRVGERRSKRLREPSQDDEQALERKLQDDDFEADVEEALEEQGDMTEEQREEYRWNRRSQHVVSQMSRLLSRSPDVRFSSMCKHNNRKQVASKFYTLLLLKKHDVVDVAQATPFADITVTEGPKFNTAAA